MVGWRIKNRRLNSGILAPSFCKKPACGADRAMLAAVVACCEEEDGVVVLEEDSELLFALMAAIMPYLD